MSEKSKFFIWVYYMYINMLRSEESFVLGQTCLILVEFVFVKWSNANSFYILTVKSN